MLTTQETGESTYEKPPEFNEASLEGGGEGEYHVTAEWVKYFDAEYAVDYYHNFR